MPLTQLDSGDWIDLAAIVHVTVMEWMFPHLMVVCHMPSGHWITVETIIIPPDPTGYPAKDAETVASAHLKAELARNEWARRVNEARERQEWKMSLYRGYRTWTAEAQQPGLSSLPPEKQEEIKRTLERYAEKLQPGTARVMEIKDPYISHCSPMTPGDLAITSDPDAEHLWRDGDICPGTNPAPAQIITYDKEALDKAAKEWGGRAWEEIWTKSAPPSPSPAAGGGGIDVGEEQTAGTPDPGRLCPVCEDQILEATKRDGVLHCRNCGGYWGPWGDRRRIVPVQIETNSCPINEGHSSPAPNDPASEDPAKDEETWMDRMKREGPLF